MRWDWRDWGVGLIVVVLAISVGLPAAPLDLAVMLPGTSRTRVEKCLGQPIETVRNLYCVHINQPEWIREQTLETHSAVSCRYSHPLGTINVEYCGYREQRVKTASFEWIWSLEIAYLLAVPLVLVTAAGLSRFVRRKFVVGAAPATA